MASPTQWTWLWVNSSGLVIDREAWHAAVHGVTKSWAQLRDWTELNSAYKLNKQGDNIQPWHTPFPIWNQSVVPCPVLTVASWPAYRFLKRQVRWSGIPISSEFSTVYCDPHSQRLWHSQESRSRYFFLELSCFFDDPADVGNLISGSSAFSKTSLNIRKFMVHVLLKPGLENFKHVFTKTKKVLR